MSAADEALADGIRAAARSLREHPSGRAQHYERSTFHFLRGYLASGFPRAAAELEAMTAEYKHPFWPYPHGDEGDML